MGEIIVDTIFKKYGFENNIQIMSTDWVSNNVKVDEAVFLLQNF